MSYNITKAIDKINRGIPVVEFLNQELGYNVGTIPVNVSCPFHKDNKPSMRLYAPKERGAYCFSCGKSYNTFDIAKYVYSLQGIENYFDIVERLSKSFGIDLSNMVDDTGEDFDFNNLEAAKIISKVFEEGIKSSNNRISFRNVEIALYKAKKSGSMEPIEKLNEQELQDEHFE